MAQWSKVQIRRDNGSLAEAQAPIIVSASRSTDIPAFYSDWFFNRLNKGYSAWTNPFNGVRSFVSYEKTRFIVFWSKNPRPLLAHIDELQDRGINCYIQYTLNDYESERLERNVPPLAQRIETFHLLKEKLGLGGVVWRFDPMILTDIIGVDDLLQKVEKIGNQLVGETEKLVFSFADILEYKKVKANLEKSGVPYRVWDVPQMEQMAQGLSELNQRWNFKLATCGEKIDISKYGIEHNRCIDGDLIVRRAYNDKDLMDFMKVEIKTADLFGVPEDAIVLPNGQYFISGHKKDLGQRELCGCMDSKDIGEYNTCPHLCEYCYANTSKEIAVANWRTSHNNIESETIIGR
ncbi:MAG: DUF1848 domain-containing protein [Bacteroidaceae bacterium]|nr:DUF1848 domain-containing protein [Bacteroidales bacterium]MCF0184875.1 DUF1848 domain-containing protein [Bacteroidaceae bacterium]